MSTELTLTAEQIAELRALAAVGRDYFTSDERDLICSALPALLALTERPSNGEVEAMIADYAKAQGQILGNVRWARDALALLRKLSAGESHGDSTGKPARLVNEVRRLAAERDLALASFEADRAKLTRCLETQRKIEAENARLRAALDEIIDPIAGLRRRAEAEGGKLNGMAWSIANSINHLQQIARAALAAEGGGT
jgi:uncharacterized protein YPO0396